MQGYGRDIPYGAASAHFNNRIETHIQEEKYRVEIDLLLCIIEYKTD